jgi:hypothetical protein
MQHERTDKALRLESRGLSFQACDNYWKETAAYEFTALQVGRIESANNELLHMLEGAGEYVVNNRLLGRLVIPPAFHEVVTASWRKRGTDAVRPFRLCVRWRGLADDVGVQRRYPDIAARERRVAMGLAERREAARRPVQLAARPAGGAVARHRDEATPGRPPSPADPLRAGLGQRGRLDLCPLPDVQASSASSAICLRRSSCSQRSCSSIRSRHRTTSFARSGTTMSPQQWRSPARSLASSFRAWRQFFSPTASMRWRSGPRSWASCKWCSPRYSTRSTGADTAFVNARSRPRSCWASISVCR